jgi:hypothetical protein
LVAAARDFPRRVFIEDMRRDGTFLRVTWHADRSAFVVSHWERDVCVAATRVDAKDVGALSALLANGMADALTAATAPPPSQPSRQPTRQQRWDAWHRRVRELLNRRHADAEIVEFPDRGGVRESDVPRWKRSDG